LVQKAQRIDKLRADYARVKSEEWGGWSGYDKYFNEDLNNAKLAVSGLYTDYVPAFKVMFEQAGRDYAKFYEAVKLLGERSKEERNQTLRDLALMHSV
jgi:predicted aminopeptidase